jgi:lipopolysaccharide/colanic/teichoic acid biosynthesis glycosyltransferase
MNHTSEANAPKKTNQPIAAKERDARSSESSGDGSDMTRSPTIEPANIAQKAAKRLLDIVCGVIGLMVLSPLWLAICIWIKADSPGPVLYKRPIIGLRGKMFTAYKFRSMVRDAHERLLSDPALLNEYRENLKVAQDPRITKSGRWLRQSSLDEFPQLINVILGDMSLVGPRMLGDLELDRYGSDRETVLSFKPGITGLWQVSGRQTTTFERRRQLDMTYIRNWSLWLDVEILVRTIPVVVSGDGAG